MSNVNASLKQTVQIGSEQYNISHDISAEGRIDIPGLLVPANTTDLEALLAARIAQVTFVLLTSTVDLIVEVNSDSAGTPTINLKANVPYVWETDSFFDNLLTVDITALYLTNAGDDDGVFTAQVLYDVTP